MRLVAAQCKKFRVLLVEDHPLIRQAMAENIRRQRDLMVCGEADDRKGALAAIAISKPDLAIVDLTLKHSDGLELIKDIRQRHPKLFTLVLSMHDELLYAERAIRAGACGYISKQEPPAKIIQAVRKVLAGEIYWSEKAAALVASKIAISARNSQGSPPDRLSERELQVFELIGVGASTRQIGASLHIDVSTVETYRARIKEKLELKDAAALLQCSIRWNVTRTAG